MQVFRLGSGLRSELNVMEAVELYLIGQHQRKLEVRIGVQ